MNGYAEPYPLSSLGLFACKYFYSALFLTLFSSTITIARTVESLRGYRSKAGPGKEFLFILGNFKIYFLIYTFTQKCLFIRSNLLIYTKIQKNSIPSDPPPSLQP